ncbi:MAG: thiamine pyrophosphate-binding protein [Candidatus Gastranaerophilales bacterium]|nr:thiamine pyrophosphate-binding protein [Candidatus Gastranaerophilales bacterium]
MIKLSDFIAKYLSEKYNVTNFFMVSGGGAMHLNDSLGHGIKSYIANHHEQACAIAAEGYARVYQELAVVNVTTGPGGLNCLNGVFGQWTDSVPVLYISGQVKYTTTMDSCKDLPLRQLGDQEVDIISVVKPLTKYAETVFEPNEIKYHIDRAVYEATTGRKGPVWLNIPMNVQGALIDEKALKEFSPSEQKPKSLISMGGKIDEIFAKLKTAKRPLIIAGHGIRLAKCENLLEKLLEKINVPVVTTFNGFDLIDDENEHYVGRIGTIGQRAGNFALQNADFILCLGTRNNIRQVSYNWENFAKKAFKIVVDIDKAELEKPLVKPDMAINADLADLIPQIIDGTDSVSASDEWFEYCNGLKKKYSFENEDFYRQKENEPINPYYFVRKLTENTKENDIFVMANGSACVCTFQVGKIKKNQRYILNSGNASMGFDLPAAIGANLAGKGRRTICLAGDGSVMMNLQELETIAFNKLPIKIFIINNAGYSSIRQTQRNFFNGRMTGSGDDSGVGMPDFSKVAAAFGLKTVKIENADNLDEKIQNVLNTDGAIVCEVMVQKEYSFIPKLSSRKLEDGTMISPSLEDMFPFVDREEYKQNMLD